MLKKSKRAYLQAIERDTAVRPPSAVFPGRLTAALGRITLRSVPHRSGAFPRLS